MGEEHLLNEKEVVFVNGMARALLTATMIGIRTNFEDEAGNPMFEGKMAVCSMVAALGRFIGQCTPHTLSPEQFEAQLKDVLEPLSNYAREVRRSVIEGPPGEAPDLSRMRPEGRA